ncbi:MAG: pyrroline-5-carboxylate reductase [Candidatus Omnitrophica bacterium]|nr:pyrroline-5-carboxylate reductase [Candidatus Omnitrophota bacterium]
MKIKQTVGFLGCGNMGGAILGGLVRRKIASPAQVWAYDAVPSKSRELARKFNIRAAASIAELAAKSRILILAVKPQDFAGAAAELRNLLTQNHLVITILAGISLARVRTELGPRPALVRAMPNLAAVVGESMTAVTGEKRYLKAAEAIFSGCGEIVRLPENLFDAVTALSGSGPAYFFYLIESLVAAGRQCGVPARECERLVRQTAKGAALLADRSEEPAEALRKRVTSKGGTTEAAVAVFDKSGLSKIVRSAVRAAVRRAKRLGNSQSRGSGR